MQSAAVAGSFEQYRSFQAWRRAFASWAMRAEHQHIAMTPPASSTTTGSCPQTGHGYSLTPTAS